MTDLRLRYQTIEFGKTDIHLCTLRDRQQFHDPKGLAEAFGISSASWPLFGLVWPSSIALAQYMDGYDTGAARILEVGCGIALPSLLLNKRHADITATDYHPEAETFLLRNAKLNQDEQIDFERVNWSDTADDLGLFDIIIGSDLLYEDEHIALLANFINDHAKPTCEVILVDPGRGRKTKLSTHLTRLGFKNVFHDHPTKDHPDQEFSGYILRFEKASTLL